MSRRRHWGGLWLGGVLLLLTGCGSEAPGGVDDEPFSITDALAGEEGIEGYARVTGPRPFRFPEDHGSHPDYRHEWWYITGNLTTDTGRRFGYQVTFFRFNVAPAMREREAGLATDQVWMAHLALADVETGRFLHAERFARGAGGLAGATVRPFRVWLEDWSLSGGQGESIMPLRFTAESDGFAVDLRMDAVKPLVLQGEQGYSRKGADPGNASHYYSYTRLRTRGEIRVNGADHRVEGASWMDREWGTSALDQGQEGWDWFSLQLDDGREIMFYRLRRRDGVIDPRSEGVLVGRSGGHRLLTHDAVRLEAVRHWTSPDSGVRYPVAWDLTVPGAGLDLRVEAVMDDQELRGDFRYWEGAVDVTGDSVSGLGYAELTGYSH